MEHVLEIDRVPAVLTFQASGRSRRVDEQPADVASGLGALAATIRAVAAGDQDAFA